MNVTEILTRVSPYHILKEGFDDEKRIKEEAGLSPLDSPIEAGMASFAEIQGNRVSTIAKFTGSLLLPPAVLLAAHNTIEAIGINLPG